MSTAKQEPLLRRLSVASLVPEVEGFRIVERWCRRLESQDAVWRALAEGPSSSREGWMMLTGRVVCIEFDDALPRGDETPLDAELRMGDSVSWHLRHREAGVWELRELERSDDPDAYGLRRYFFEEASDRHLVYEVGWELATDAFGERVLAPRRTRFAGFERL